MSQDTTTTTAPPLMVVCSSASSVTTVGYDCPQGPIAASAQQNEVLPPPLVSRDTRIVVGLTTVLQQVPQSQRPSQDYANYAMGPPQVSFSFRVEPLTNCLYIWCLFWCMLSPFRFQCGCLFHLWGLNCWGLHHHSPLEQTHGRHMGILVMVWGHTRNALNGFSLHCFR